MNKIRYFYLFSRSYKLSKYLYWCLGAFTTSLHHPAQDDSWKWQHLDIQDCYLLSVCEKRKRERLREGGEREWKREKGGSLHSQSDLHVSRPAKSVVYINHIVAYLNYHTYYRQMPRYQNLIHDYAQSYCSTPTIHDWPCFAWQYLMSYRMAHNTATPVLVFSRPLNCKKLILNSIYGLHF